MQTCVVHRTGDPLIYSLEMAPADMEMDAVTIGVPATVDLGEFGTQEAIIGSARNLFGYAVAVSGIMLVGRPDDHSQGIRTGAAYVYKHQQGRWVHVVKLLSN